MSDAEVTADVSPYLVCDNCGHYPLEPVHGHFICHACNVPTKCCEGAPLIEQELNS